MGTTVLTSFSAVADSNEMNTTLNQVTPHILQDKEVHPADNTPIANTQAEVTRDIMMLSRLSKADIAAKITDVTSQAIEPFIEAYPVHSTLLNPGIVKSQASHATLMHPLFIVGDDKESKAWLTQYQKRLIAIHAQGFVVNVESANTMNALQQKFPQLPMMAIPGDGLAQWLHLKHYPVLISNNVIEQ
ncbi:MAG: integrating conjugative element protein [Gammaproteobacteria bacterium]|nr:integrating conjugative element protein [Gammaproteobacteria bacterium]MBY0544843.1 integrating conjugative element protein [Gammaproteobacteria bacterium]